MVRLVLGLSQLKVWPSLRGDQCARRCPPGDQRAHRRPPGDQRAHRRPHGDQRTHHRVYLVPVGLDGADGAVLRVVLERAPRAE